MITLRSAAGFVLTYSYTITEQTFLPGTPIPAYLSFIFGLSCGFAVEHNLSFIFVNGGFDNWDFRPVSNITIDLCFMFAIKAGVGIEGFLDIWVKATASLDFLVNMSISSPKAWSLVVTFSLDLSVGATLILVSISTTFNVATVQLYPSSSANLLQHYMQPSGDDPEMENPTYGEPRNYPDLTAEPHWALKPGDRDTGNFSRYSKIWKLSGWVGGSCFIFDIVDGDIRWVSTETTEPLVGSVRDSLVEIKDMTYNHITTDDQVKGIEQAVDRTFYDYGVYPMDDYLVMTVACAKYYYEDGPDKGCPIPNGSTLLPDDYRDNNIMSFIFVYRLVEIIDPPDGHRVSLAIGVEVSLSDWDAGPACLFDITPVDISATGGYDAIVAPEVTWADLSVDYDNTNATCSAIGNYKPYSYPSRIKDHEPTGAVGFAYRHVMVGGTSSINYNYRFFPESTVAGGDGETPSRTAFHSVMRKEDIETAAFADVDSGSFSWIAVNGAGSAETQKNLEYYDYSMNTPGGKGQQAMVLKEGISHYTFFPQLDTDKDPVVAFYSYAERNGFGNVQERLHGIRVTKSDDGNVWNVEDNEYDIVIPGGKFDIINIGSIPYIYWMTAADKEDDSDKTVWQLWIVAYDAPTDMMSDPMVFAEFSMPDGYEDWIVGDIICRGTMDCYVKVFSPDPDVQKNGVGIITFKPILLPTMELQGAVPHELAVKAGDFEDLSLNVLNDGNLAVTTLDVTMYDVSDGKETETVHINALEPEKNWIEMADMKGVHVMTGESVAYREEDFNMTSRQRDWIVGQQSYEYSVEVSDDGDEITVSPGSESSTAVCTDVVMPGSDAGFTATFKIPDDWTGKKTLRMKITAVSAESNITRRLAQLNGIKAVGADDSDAAGLSNPSATLEYRLDPASGKLVLDTSSENTARLLASPNGSLYAREIEASSLDLPVDVHDLEVTHRVYRGLDGERWLDMTVKNGAATKEELKLTCAVYVDGGDTPVWLALPVYPEATASRMAHTYSMRLSDLVDHPEKHHKLRVDVQIVGRNEDAYANNEFFVTLDGSDSPTPPPPVPPVTGDTARPWLAWLLIGLGLLLPAACFFFIRRRKEGD